MMESNVKQGLCIVPGIASGELLVTDTSLSFWGGIDPASGRIIDKHHPLCGQTVSGKVLALPGSRGSSSGSGVILELLQNSMAPAALVFCEREEVVTLGVIVSQVLFARGIPVLRLQRSMFNELHSGDSVLLVDDSLSLNASESDWPVQRSEDQSHESGLAAIELDESDHQMLKGADGKAAQVAMEIVTRMAVVQGATHLIDVTQGHIDACVYNGPSSLAFAERLLEWGATVRVPTTLNSLSVDKRRWRKQGVDPDFADPADRLGDTYVAMGARASFTCAPYLLDSRPAVGEQIAWAESNAVMYANSVLGARTQKYPDFLDVAIAITGRAAAAGAHLDGGRVADVIVLVEYPDDADDLWWPLLGHCIGALAGHRLPLICGLEQSAPGSDDLKAFCAAFATTSTVAMFHMKGITPEADRMIDHLEVSGGSLDEITVKPEHIAASWRQLNSGNTGNTTSIDVVSLGNPHFSSSECASLARLCEGRKKHEQVEMIITLGREVYEYANSQGHIEPLEAFGATFVTDTCWCMITAPVIPSSAKALLTNSGKYAHYGPGLIDRPVFLANLAHCVEVACTTVYEPQLPDWISV